MQWLQTRKNSAHISNVGRRTQKNIQELVQTLQGHEYRNWESLQTLVIEAVSLAITINWGTRGG